jgi:nucleotide-binding universal stress UspA family protein
MLGKEESNSKSSTNFPARKILLAVDGSKNSLRASEVAIALSKQNLAALVILNVISPMIIIPPPIGMDSSGGIESYYENSEKTGEELIRRITDSARKENLPDVQGFVERSATSTVETIVQIASEKNIDLIVIGTRGLGGFKRLLLGSVSGGVVTHAHCNVLVVR